jgi:hypothetical protein
MKINRVMVGLFSSGCVLFYAITAPAGGWDPVGDIKHPDRIPRNVARETGNAVKDIPNVPRNVVREVDNLGREIDRARLEAQAQAGAPILAAWLQASRNSAFSSAVPMPSEIRVQLEGYYDDDVLNRARFKIGDTGAFNIAGLTIRYGDNVNAVTLIDVVVFRDPSIANDPAIWAHELKHVQQYRDWGVHDFAIRYIRSWNGVEDPAYAAENAYPGWRQRAAR